MKADVSRGSNPTEGEVTTTGDPTVETPVSPNGSSNGSPALEVEGSQREMSAGAEGHAQPTLLSGPLSASDITTGPLLGRSRRSWLRLPVIRGLSLDDRLGRLAL